MENELEVVEGMKFDRGYISPYFVTDAKTMKAELEDPFILIAEKKISSCVPFQGSQGHTHATLYHVRPKNGEVEAGEALILPAKTDCSLIMTSRLFKRDTSLLYLNRGKAIIS